MKRFTWLALFASCCLLLTSAQAADGKRPPNIVYILADDLGWTDTATYGSDFYETPNIDRLASQGVKFKQYHNCQNCQPTRAALMTGQYGARTGIYTVGAIDRFDWATRPLRPADNVTTLALDRATIADQLKAAGYVTGMFGKWHLGDDAKHHPSKRGFDEAISSAGKHFDFATNPKTPYPEGTYLADFLTDKAVDFIQRHKEQPFFLYVPHYGVHSPHDAKEQWIKHFQEKLAKLNKVNDRKAGGHSDPVYAAMIASVDESVGRICQTLDDLKLSDNTVVIFSSDNGGVGGYFREGIKQEGSITDNAPLRSGKGSLYEGGTRDPLIVKWPNKVTAGSICDIPAIHVDMYPTLLEIAGAAKPKHELDGESLVKVMKDPQATLSREAIYQHFPGYLGAGPGEWRTTPVGTIQMGDWKLMEFFEDGRLELYNLKDDLGESKNLAKDMPEKTQELRAKMVQWREAINAPMPTKNDQVKPVEPKAKGGKKKKAAK